MAQKIKTIYIISKILLFMICKVISLFAEKDKSADKRIILLFLVLIPGIGDTGGGAQRWINLGFITIQPSEIAKMAVVMMLALYLSSVEGVGSAREVAEGLTTHPNATLRTAAFNVLLGENLFPPLERNNIGS